MRKVVLFFLFSVLPVCAFCEGMYEYAEQIKKEYSDTDRRNLMNLIVNDYKICGELDEEEIDHLTTIISLTYMMPIADADYYLGSVLFELAIKHQTPYWKSLDYKGRISVVSKMLPELRYIRYMDNKSVRSPALLSPDMFE
jgi:hypothetical protein